MNEKINLYLQSIVGLLAINSPVECLHPFGWAALALAWLLLIVGELIGKFDEEAK